MMQAIADTQVELDAEGFFVDPERWTPEMAPEIARSSANCFPKGPAKLAAKIGGVPKPRGCI